MHIAPSYINISAAVVDVNRISGGTTGISIVNNVVKQGMVVARTDIDTVQFVTCHTAVLYCPAIDTITIEVDSVPAVGNLKAIDDNVVSAGGIYCSVITANTVDDRLTAGRVTLERNGLADVPLLPKVNASV